MNSLRITKKRIAKFVVFILFVFILLPTGLTYADHLPGNDASDPPVRWSSPGFATGVIPNNLRQPCRIQVGDLENREVNIRPGNVGSGAGEVPVYDNDINRNLVSLIDALARSAEFSEFQDGDVQRTAEYLRLLCEKEYEEDHTLQHAWANLIGEFVNETLRFVHRGYNGNPAFITNQPAYYQLVNLNVSRVFLQDIVDSNIGEETKRKIILDVTNELYAYDYPYNDPNFVVAGDDLPEDLSEEGTFYANGGYDALGRLLLYEQGGDETVAVQKAREALNLRKTEQMSYEKEKLDWGRGFFSYEVCDLNVFPTSNQDRRNCRIATPGALIQDETSFVFGSALRQMELNDEYEEWIAPNTVAVLSDILSFRGLNTLETRNTNPTLVGFSEGYPSTEAAPPTDPFYTDSVVRPSGLTVDNLQSIITSSTYGNSANENPDGPDGDAPLPYEFEVVIDDAFFDYEKSGGALEVFGEFLDPGCFLDQINNPNPESCTES